jgi:hypothetical protein
MFTLPEGGNASQSLGTADTSHYLVAVRNSTINRTIHRRRVRGTVHYYYVLFISFFFFVLLLLLLLLFRRML